MEPSKARQPSPMEHRPVIYISWAEVTFIHGINLTGPVKVTLGGDGAQTIAQ